MVMGGVTLFVALWGICGTLANAAPEVDESSPPLTLLDAYRNSVNGLQLFVYDSANWCLDNVIQSKTLDFVLDDISSFKDLTSMDYINQHWQSLVLYMIGYIVVLSAGLLSFIGMALTYCCCCCCCCKCCCGSTRKPRKPKCACCRISCVVLLFISLSATVLGGIAMLSVNQELKRQLAGEASVFNQVKYVVKEIPDFLKQTLVNQSNSLR